MATQAGLAAVQPGAASCSRCSGIAVAPGAVRRRFVAAGLAAVDQPARSSAIPRLVPPERLPSAIALNQLNFQTGLDRRAGRRRHPHRDGRAGRRLRGRPRVVRRLVPGPARHRAAAAARRRRAARARRRSARACASPATAGSILGSFVIDLNAMIFGMPTSLFPVARPRRVPGRAAGLGLLAAAPAAGAFLGALFSGWVVERPPDRPGDPRRGRRLGPGDHRVRAALARCSLPVSALRCVMLAVAGAADVFSAVFRVDARPARDTRPRCAAASPRSTPSS